MGYGPQFWDVLNGDGVFDSLTVGTTAVELKVGASILSNRQAVTIQPQDGSIFFGYSSSVTTSNGTEIFKKQLVTLPVGPEISVWLIASSSNKDVRIGELS